MAFTPFANELFLDWLLTTGTAVRPTTWYIAWHIGSPGDDGSTNEQVVGNDPDYARQAVTIGSAAWSTALKAAVSRNSSSVTITPATGVSYDVLALSIWDSLTGGNCIAAIPTKAAIPVSDVAPVTFIAGKIPIIISSNNSAVSLTSYSAALVLDWLFTTDAVTRPTAWYLGLHSADPGDAGSANEIAVGDDPDYVRKAITFAAAATISGSDSYTRTSTDAIWTPGTGSDYTVPFVVTWDALSTGNALLNIPCAPEKIGIAAQTLSVSANEVTVSARV